MPEKTNMEMLKGVGRRFLMLDPIPTEYSPMIVKHPFTDCGHVYIPNEQGNGFNFVNIMSDKEGRMRWQEYVNRLINDAKDPAHLFMHITKSYKFAFIKYAKPYLSKDDFSEYLVNAWVMTEAPNSDPNFTKKQLVGLFKDANPQVLMNEEEFKIFEGLEETMLVYRGVTSHNDRNIKALSWTLDIDKAEWFAKRFGEEGKVYQGIIDKPNVLAYFNHRGESEIIVNPYYLRNIEIYDNLAIGPNMDMQIQ